MMFEMYWLLLLMAGAAGWYLAYIYYRSRPKPKIPGEYLKGLNYLLDEQPDKALEVFIDLVDVDTETVETYLILGNMFRRRGEVDRAIRIHQNLIARPALGANYRSTALLELAKDYFKAGLLDRAESLFVEVVKLGLQAEEAYPLLLSLYEQEKEWEMAIETATEMQKKSDKRMNQTIAHYYCELSEQEFAGHAGDLAAARKMARKALSHDKGCARANVLLGNYAMHEKNCRVAIKHYTGVFRQKPEYLPEIFLKLREAFLMQDNQDGFRQFLLKIRDSKLSGILLPALLTNLTLNETERNEVLQLLEHKPELSLPEISAFLENLRQQEKSLGELGADRIQASIENFISGCNSHQCRQCGFQGKRLYWQCPSCHYWGTVIPVVPGLE